jgi:hypothetical protein
MTQYAAVLFVLRFVVGCLFFSLIYATIIKFLERVLTFRQAYLISLITNLVSGALFAAYAFAKARVGFSPALDAAAHLALLMLMGFIITRLAANYGIKKEGWFGLGARVVFAIFLLAVVFMIVITGFNLLIAVSTQLIDAINAVWRKSALGH